MNLFLLRHGIAAVRDPAAFAGDAARPLTPKGRRQLNKIASAMKNMGLDFDLVLSSPFLRAKQTAELVADRLKLKRRLKFSTALTPAGDVTILIRQLNALKPVPENILLVGHEPYLSRLISLLVADGQPMPMDFKKGGLCRLEIEKLRFGSCATLAWLLTPKQMKMMA